MIVKSLLLPVNLKKELFIQDRRGHKKPNWGYFGGGMEDGETPLETVIRESREELCLNLEEKDLIYLGTSTTDWGGVIVRHLYLYFTEQIQFDVREGKGGVWLSFDKARERFDDKDRFGDVIQRIDLVLASRI